MGKTSRRSFIKTVGVAAAVPALDTQASVPEEPAAPTTRRTSFVPNTERVTCTTTT